LIFEDDEREKFPAGTFPLRLDAGEARYVSLQLLFEAGPGTLIKGDADGFVNGSMLFKHGTTAGPVERRGEFRVSTFQLNEVRTHHIYH
jgi:hypothetical protein